jgi:hypothetical protein
MSLLNRINYVLEGEDAFSFTEFIIWTSVILILIGPLLFMKDTVKEFLSLKIRKVGSIGPKY